MKYDVTLGGRTRSVDVQADVAGWKVSLDDAPPVVVRGRRTDTATWTLRAGDGPRRKIGVALHKDSVFVLDGEQPARGEVVDPRSAALDHAGHAGQGRVCTAMPGAVVRVLVLEGGTVASGQVLVVVEAMKMENEFKAPFAARVSTVAVVAGQAVEAGSLLVVLEPIDG